MRKHLTAGTLEHLPPGKHSPPCEGQHSKAHRHNTPISIRVSPVTPADTGAAVIVIHQDSWANITTSHPQELTSWLSLKLVSEDESPLIVPHPPTHRGPQQLGPTVRPHAEAGLQDNSHVLQLARHHQGPGPLSGETVTVM